MSSEDKPPYERRKHKDRYFNLVLAMTIKAKYYSIAKNLCIAMVSPLISDEIYADIPFLFWNI